MLEPSPSQDQPPRRKPVPKRVRFEVLRRDNYTCRYCKSTDGPLTIDHVTPDVLGGTNDPSNLVTACKDCNAGKASSAPDAATVAQVSDDAVRWADAMKFAAERLAASKAEVDERLKPWFDEWFVHSGPGWSYKLPNDADAVLTGYLAAGMPVDVLIHAARIALRKRDTENYFRYFRGVANNMLAELQADARTILASETTSPKETPLQEAYWTGYTAALRDPAIATGWLWQRTLCQVVDENRLDWRPSNAGF